MSGQQASVSSEWEATALWKAIEGRQGKEADTIRAFLASCMPKIETLLDREGTAPANFTLYDARHSFRVAETMARVIPADRFERLSVQELALLLLSAYLHDIGMAPEGKLVSSHYEDAHAERLLGLSVREAKELQTWLDEEADGAAPPAAPARLTADALRSALRMTALYCRAKQGEWGESWLRETDSWFDGGTYLAWTDALLRLCRHLQGYEGLTGGGFDPRPIGGPGPVVRLRFVAAVLQVADAVEFDRSRNQQLSRSAAT